MLSLRRIKSFVFARQASPRHELSARLAIQKRRFLFSRNSTWPLSDKGLSLSLKFSFLKYSNYCMCIYFLLGIFPIWTILSSKIKYKEMVLHYRRSPEQHPPPEIEEFFHFEVCSFLLQANVT